MIGKADSRFVGQDVTQLQSRFCIVDCRLQSQQQQLVIRDVKLQLAMILQQHDAWDLRLQALEKFAQDHGRLPRQLSALLHEKSLATWMQNLARLVKEKMLPAARMQKLLNSPCIKLRARIAKWLATETPFEQSLDELRQFVEVHHHMPRFRKTSSESETRLRNRIETLVNPLRTNHKRRLQILAALDPIVANWVRSQRAKKLKIRKSLWQRQFQRLLEFVKTNDRLPKRKDRENALYTWLCTQRLQLDRLPPELQAALANSHPRVASFLLA